MIPDYLTRYYVAGENPFTSLNDLPMDEANRIKLAASDKYGWGGFYAQNDYLIHRREIEKWICGEFIKKGGKPRDEVPIYAFLGDTQGKFEKFGEDTSVLRIPLSALDCSAISFVWPDSMYEAETDESGFTGRTDTPKVYRLYELDAVMEAVSTYNALPNRQAPLAMVEAQIWDRAMLHVWHRLASRVNGGTMRIHLVRATVDDSARIHEMQLAGFRALLDKYQDFDTNPGAETLERVRRRFSFDTVDHYFICLTDEAIGYIRVQRLEGNICRLSQMFILPDFQGKGYAQEAIRAAESLYPQARKWTLDTIKQEAKLCHLYEKMGYRLTGTGKHIKDGMDLVDYAKDNR